MESTIKLDFEKSFPCIFYTSDWADSDDGKYRFKLLSAWNPSSEITSMTLYLQSDELVKTVILSDELPFSDFEIMSQELIEKIEKEHNVTFESQNFINMSESKFVKYHEVVGE